MAESTEPLVQTCATCGALIDVSGEEPFALMHCPNCGTGMRVRRSFDHFELQEVLGAGGMGTVYRALDQNLNRQVALKLLRPEYSSNPEFLSKFQAEAAITASINHPNVVRVFSSGEDHGLIYLAMELVDKGSLDDLMTLQGRVAEIQVLEVGLQIARGLQAALQRGLIHRDIKPGNILFADAHTAKIVDFGLAIFMDQQVDADAEVWGTPYYVAPEKLDNQPEDLRSDIYSLGASLFHAVAGRPPFEAETASMVALKHLKSQAVSLQAFAPDVSSATAYVINKTLNKDPAQRYQTYEELIEHLEYARTELAAKAAQPRKQTRVVLESEREQRMMSWITFGMIAIVVLTGVVLFTMRDRGTPAPTKAEQQATAAAAAAATRYEEARQKLIGGQIAEALPMLREMEEQPDLAQPTRNWISVHAGMAELLSGNVEGSREHFAALVRRGAYSTDPAEQKMARFFLELGESMQTTSVSPASEAREYNKENFEALGLFLLALKNWELGGFDEAGALFRQFLSSPLRKREPGTAPSPNPHEWIADYRDMASEYMADFSEYRSVAEQLKDPETPEKQKKAIEEARALRPKLQRGGKLTSTIEALISELEQKLTAVEEEQARKAAAEDAADAKVFAQVKPKVAALTAQFKFAEAKQELAGAKLSGAKGKREHGALMKRIEYLARFKSLLIRDITAATYPHPIATKTNTAVPGVVASATEQGVQVKTKYGAVPVPWTEISLDHVLAMARYFIRPDMSEQLVSDRKWLLGVFSFFARKEKEGRTLVAEAAQSRKEYADELSLFLEFAESR